ncbi:MAG TPA: helix-turn-helix transcriptional regulator [Solirubrobacteraceae bacterium]|jgi:DNA-binding CsgD family transcriptional regulator|nr:helix-turn-helix transcriptional regulator [Solirubrobacteraceae bacterium]
MTAGHGTWRPERTLADLERLALRAPTRAQFFDEAAARLRRTVAFDGACWHTLDPGSSLITQHRLQDLPDRFSVLANNEYAVEDVNKFDQLARANRKAATLQTATGGRPELSRRFRDLLTPAGLGPELRGAFVADGVTWGALILVRRAGRPEFADDEVELIAAASALFARAVRRGLVAEVSGSPASGADPPGVIELDGSGGLLRMSSSAESLLAELSGSSAQAGVEHPAIHAVASATRSAVAARTGTAGSVLPSSTVKTADGTWLVLHGALLGDVRSHAVAVFIQRAHPTLVAPLLLKAYGLTPREREVAQLLLRGATTIQASRRLGISGYTVTDHVKSIFEKVGARTRGELWATLFFGEHLPRIENRVPVGDDASFVDAPRPRGHEELPGG